MQNVLLNIPVNPNDEVVTQPPSSWIQAAMNANLVDQHHDARVSLMDAVKRGFSFENISQYVYRA